MGLRSAFEGKLLVREVAVTGDDDGVDDAREEGRVGVGEREAQEDMGRGGQDHKSHGKADTVHGETADPLLEVVALGAEDEVFVAEERDRDAHWGRDHESDVSDKRLTAVWEQMA